MFGYDKKIEEKELEIQKLTELLSVSEEKATQMQEQLSIAQSQVEQNKAQAQFAKGLFSNLNHFSTSLSALQGTLAGMAGVLKSEKDNAILAATEMAQARNVSTRVTSELQDFSRVVTEAVPHTESLKNRADEIGNIISLINNVSDQTNLLALNAAIEAARAGEHGRGFAVVADEVRVLSQRTNEATKGITNEVNSIQTGTVTVQQQMHTISEKSVTLSEDSEWINRNMTTVIETANKLEAAVSAGALRSFVELAKADHLVFKFEIYKVLMEESAKQPDEFACHTECRLGKWYHSGEGVQCYSRLPGYQELDAPHEKVHQSGVKATELAHSGDLDGAIQYVADMEAASEQVQSCLEQMAQAAEQEPTILCHSK